MLFRIGANLGFWNDFSKISRILYRVLYSVWYGVERDQEAEMSDLASCDHQLALYRSGTLTNARKHIVNVPRTIPDHPWWLETTSELILDSEILI